MKLDQLIQNYKAFYAKKQRRPKSVREFCRLSNVERKDFKAHFKSLFGIERNIWERFALETIQRVQSAPHFEEFMAQEKVMAFYYTLLEVMRQDESFVKHNLQRMSKTAFISDYTDKFRQAFKRFIEHVLQEAADQETEEVKLRPVISGQYPKLFWLQLIAILNYWKKDSSEGNENTDAFVEKSVQLLFDLISKGPLDSALDLGKFLLSNNNE